jgi:hypothetical protein
VAELVHALVLGTSEETHKGSTPFSCTKGKNNKKLVNTGGKLVRECLQQCVQYVSNDANIKTKKLIAVRSILTTGSLRKKFTVIHKWIFSYYYCYSSLTFHKINHFHLWLVLQTTANITRTVFARKFTGGLKCSTNVHR